MNYTDNEKRLLSIIESNIEHHNNGRRKNRLSILAYVAGGNRIDICLNGVLLAGMLTVEETYYFIFGAVAYAEKVEGKRK